MNKKSDITWLYSVYSDGSASFVSNPEPVLGETVTMKLQLLEHAPVTGIYLDYIRNGIHIFIPMKKVEGHAILAVYSADIKITEKKTRYHFILLTDEAMYHYTQKGVTPYEQTDNYDFQLMTDYHQPAWVKSAVFYQIFPERFANGDPALDVKDGEFSVNGWPSIHVKDWNQPAAPYDEVHCLDFYGGDLPGIREKIPYLKELGVTALYLNPIFHAPSVHKYDCIDYEEVDPHLGGDGALADLTSALHENDMKVMLDISINHTGVAHKWFNRDCLYFEESIGAYHNPDAKERRYYHIKPDNSYRGWNNVDTMPTLDYNSQELREKVYVGSDSVLKKWLKPPYNIDGWLGGFEGCRYPMPWKDDMTESDIFRLHQKLAKLKKGTPALSDGGFKILYAKGRTLAFARVKPEGSVVTVFNTEEQDTEVVIPIQNIGGTYVADEAYGCTDLLGVPMQVRLLEDGSLRIKLPAHQSYVFAV